MTQLLQYESIYHVFHLRFIEHNYHLWFIEHTYPIWFKKRSLCMLLDSHHSHYFMQYLTDHKCCVK